MAKAQRKTQQAAGTSGISATGSNDSGSATRRQILGLIIQKSRLACSLPVPEPDELLLTVGAWDEVLYNVPTDWLDKCYVRAMRHHAHDKAPFGAAQIVRVWQDIYTSGEFHRWQVEQGRSLTEGNGQKAGVPPTEEFLDAMEEFIRKHRMPGSRLRRVGSKSTMKGERADD